MEENSFEVTLPSSSFNTELKQDNSDILWSSGLGKVTLEVGKRHTIILQSMDGVIEVYNIYPNRDIAQIKNIILNETFENYTFDKHTYRYDLSVDYKIESLNLTVEPEEGVTYDITKPNKLKVGNNTIKVEAKKSGATSTTYIFNIYRKDRFVYKDFDYIGDVQSFVAPKTGIYKFEVWGAEGGDGPTANSFGGKGGYSKGYYNLSEGETVYIYVGGQGTNGTSVQPGGYNGGGPNFVGSHRKSSGSGGGATDIRTVNGTWDDAPSLANRVIVAGGGGGAGGDCASTGGGSGYIGGVISYNEDSPITIDGNSQMPTYSGNSTMIGNIGDRYAKIKMIDVHGNGDAFLDSITLNDGDISIDFAPWTYIYDITIEEDISSLKDINSLKINAVPKDVTSEVVGNGVHSLRLGNNQFDIIVTATDGTTKTYTLNVNKVASKDPSPLDIKIKNPHSYLCDKDEGTCIYQFEPSTIEYTIKVPYQSEEISLETTLRSKYQQVKYKDSSGKVIENPTFEFTSDTLTVEVVVTAENPDIERTYTYIFLRDDRGNNSLSSLSITDPQGITLNPAFNKKTYEYSITVANEIENITLEAIPSNLSATVKIAGDKNLKEGLNDCTVTVTAPNGNRRTYLVHVYREKFSNTLLDHLKIYDDQNKEIELTPTFNNLLDNYTSNVDSSIQNIRIDTSAEEGTYSINPKSTGTILNSDGTFKLVGGLNIFEIVVTSPEGKTGVYLNTNIS